eukprot:GFUD01057862.1.p1 GENE.GFUD01057862.1~~GFUD01057862.1.p1  ORF type:complete len:232 (-),score=79.04 GFUD01057862.1:117-812(-)
MSFKNFGSSPGKATEGSSRDFSIGSFFGGVDDKSGGSFLAGSGGEAGSSVFGTPIKSQASSIFGPPADLSSTTPAKMRRTDIPTSVATQAPWQQSYGQLQGHNLPIAQPLKYKQEPTGYTSPSSQPSYSGHTLAPTSKDIGQFQSLGCSQVPPEVKVPTTVKQQNMPSSVQSSVLEEKTKAIGEAKSKEEDCDDIPADALLKELLNMQKQQLTELGRQVSSFLRMIPKTEQ